MKGSGVGIYLKNQGDNRAILSTITQGLQYDIEYEATVAGLWLAKSLGTRRLKVRSDSQLVVNQVSGEYMACNTKMVSYLEPVNPLHSQFESCEVHQVPRKFICHVDVLVNLGSSSNSTIWRTIPVGYLEKPCINRLTSELAPNNSQPSDDPFSDLSVDHNSSNESVNDPPVDHYSSNDSPTNWMTPILRYIEHRELQTDKK